MGWEGSYLLIEWVLSRHLERRLDLPKRSSKTDPYPTGLGTELITPSDTTPGEETGEDPS